MGYPIKDLTGLKFGKITVLEYKGTEKHKRASWLCQCECGKQKIMIGSNLRKQKGGCGCERKPPPIFKLPEGEAAFNKTFYTYKKGAKNRNLVFNLTKDEFKNITQQNCYYCGQEPSSFTYKDFNGGYRYSGIDRVDNSIGYEINNCVACCKMCNFSKKAHSQEVFLNWISKVYLHSKGNKS